MLRYAPFCAAFVQSLAEAYQAVAGDDLREHKSFGFVHLPICAQKPRKIVSVLAALSPDLDCAIFASLIMFFYDL